MIPAGLAQTNSASEKEETLGGVAGARRATELLELLDRKAEH